MTQFKPSDRITWEGLNNDIFVKNFDRIRLFKNLVEDNKDYFIVKDAAIIDLNKDIQDALESYPYNIPGEEITVGNEDYKTTANLIL